MRECPEILYEVESLCLFSPGTSTLFDQKGGRRRESASRYRLDGPPRLRHLEETRRMPMNTKSRLLMSRITPLCILLLILTACGAPAPAVTERVVQETVVVT